MITSRVYRGGKLEEESGFDPSAFEACRASGEHRMWIDVVEPSEEELALLQGTLGLHELSVEDSRRWGQRPKVEFYPDYVFVVLHSLRMQDDDDLVDSELHLFAGQKFYLLTIRRRPLFDFEQAVTRAGRDTGIVHEGIGFQLYLLLDEVVDGYLDVIDRLEDLSDDVEERVFREEEADELQEQVFRLKRKVVRFRRAVAPMREVLDLVAEQGDVVTPQLAPYYRDVQDHVIRAIELTDNIRELLTSALETRLVQTSNRLNVVMKHLSGWAAIILVPTLIAGIYGMNFGHMPELDWRLGYPFALAMMVVSAVVLYRVFKKRDWL